MASLNLLFELASPADVAQPRHGSEPPGMTFGRDKQCLPCETSGGIEYPQGDEGVHAER